MARNRDDRPTDPDEIQARVTTPPVPGDPNLDDATLKDPSLMRAPQDTAAGAVGDPIGDRAVAGVGTSDPALSDPAATNPSAADPRVGDFATGADVAEPPVGDPATREGRVAVYDRPASRGPSGLIIGAVVLVIVVLVVIFLIR